MKKPVKYFLLAAASSLLSVSALASSLVGVTGTLKNLEKSVNVAIQKSDSYFEEKKGARLPGKINLLNNNNTNPYVNTLQIMEDYKVVMQLSGGNPNPSGAPNVASPVAQVLLGKSFIFVPVYENGDAVITSWECITDADKNVREFIGNAGAKENSRSYISAQTSNKYLTTCIYVSDLSPYTSGLIRQKDD